MLRIARLATVVLLVSLSVAPVAPGSEAADSRESFGLVRVATGSNYIGRDGDIYVTEFRSVHGVGALSSRRVVLHVPTTNKDTFGHYAGQLAFGPDGRLYASFGDADQPQLAQDPTILLGKLVRLDVDRPGAEPEVRALGLRNPWRFSFDRATGDVYIGDVGQDLREEVDRLPRAFRGLANFG